MYFFLLPLSWDWIEGKWGSIVTRMLSDDQMNKNKYDLSFYQGDRETSPEGGGRRVLRKYVTSSLVEGSDVVSVVTIITSALSSSINLLCDSCLMCLHDPGHAHRTNQPFDSMHHDVLAVDPALTDECKLCAAMFYRMNCWSWTELITTSWQCSGDN